MIQEQERKKLHQIIREVGINGFMEIENQVNASIEAERSVIATGGSVVYCQQAMSHLKEIGTVVLSESFLEYIGKEAWKSKKERRYPKKRTDIEGFIRGKSTTL